MSKIEIVPHFFIQRNFEFISIILMALAIIVSIIVFIIQNMPKRKLNRLEKKILSSEILPEELTAEREVLKYLDNFAEVIEKFITLLEKWIMVSDLIQSIINSKMNIDRDLLTEYIEEFINIHKDVKVLQNDIEQIEKKSQIEIKERKSRSKLFEDATITIFSFSDTIQNQMNEYLSEPNKYILNKDFFYKILKDFIFNCFYCLISNFHELNLIGNSLLGSKYSKFERYFKKMEKINFRYTEECRERFLMKWSAFDCFVKLSIDWKRIIDYIYSNIDWIGEDEELKTLTERTVYGKI